MKSIREYLNILNEEQQLNELADAPYSFSSNKRSSGGFTYKFTTNEKSEFEVDFTKEYHGNYYLSFSRESTLSDQSYLPYSINGGGDAFRVFATVKTILMNFIKENKPEKIRFDSSEDSRTKLYIRMMKYLERIIPEYQFEVNSNKTRTIFLISSVSVV